MFVIFDIGGTYTRIALVKNQTSFYYITRFRTSLSYREQLKSIEKALSVIPDFSVKSVERVVIGVAGIISLDGRNLVCAPNLPKWNGKALADDISNLFDVKDVVLMNDAVLGAIGEACFGAGSGYDLVAFLSVGTGVGGALVQGENPIFSNVEPGHMIVDHQGDVWSSCGQSGCLESFVSGKAIQARFGIESLNECDDNRVIDDIAKKLSIGLVNLSLLWSPDCIVLGGGVVHHSPSLYKKTVLFFRRSLLKGYPRPDVRKGSLKDNASLYGGLKLIL